MYKNQIRDLLIQFEQYDESIAKISKIPFLQTEELKEQLENFNINTLWKVCSQFVTKAYRNIHVTLMNQLDILVPPDIKMATLCWEDITPRLKQGVPDNLYEILAINLKYYLQSNRLPTQILNTFPILHDLNFCEPGVIKNLPELIRQDDKTFTTFLHMLDTAEKHQHNTINVNKQDIALNLSLIFVKIPKLFEASYKSIKLKLVHKRLYDLNILTCQVNIIIQIKKQLPTSQTFIKKYPILAEKKKHKFWKTMLTYTRSKLMKILRTIRISNRNPKEKIHRSSTVVPFKDVISFVHFHVNDIYPQLSEYVNNIYFKVYNGTGILKHKEINNIRRLYQTIHVRVTSQNSSNEDSSEEDSSEEDSSEEDSSDSSEEDSSEEDSSEEDSSEEDSSEEDSSEEDSSEEDSSEEDSSEEDSSEEDSSKRDKKKE